MAKFYQLCLSPLHFFFSRQEAHRAGANGILVGNAPKVPEQTQPDLSIAPGNSPWSPDLRNTLNNGWQIQLLVGCGLRSVLDWPCLDQQIKAWPTLSIKISCLATAYMKRVNHQ